MRTLGLALLLSCHPPVYKSSSPVTDSGAIADSGDTADSADSADTGETGDVADSADSADTADTSSSYTVAQDAPTDFSLVDQNPGSLRYGEAISPRDYLEQVSGWYFIHAT